MANPDNAQIDESPLLSIHSPTSGSFASAEGQVWERYIHPNGVLYWYFRTEGIVTDEDPGGAFIAQRILERFPTDWHDRLQMWEAYLTHGGIGFVHHESRLMSNGIETFLEFEKQVRSGGGDMADSKLLYIICMRSSTPTAYTGLKSEAAYWDYVQGHPNHLTLPPAAELDAKEAVLWCCGGRSISKSALAKSNPTWWF
jgi:hypothetical protein